jgi:hypothetical protein
VAVLRSAVEKFSTFSFVVGMPCHLLRSLRDFFIRCICVSFGSLSDRAPDELPAIAFVGYTEATVEEDGSDVVRHYLNTHLILNIGTNGDQVRPPPCCFHIAVFPCFSSRGWVAVHLF